jgi:hypothetical protein
MQDVTPHASAKRQKRDDCAPHARNVPDDIWCLILRFMAFPMRFTSVALVCKSWNRIAYQNIQVVDYSSFGRRELPDQVWTKLRSCNSAPREIHVLNPARCMAESHLYNVKTLRVDFQEFAGTPDMSFLRLVSGVRKLTLTFTRTNCPGLEEIASCARTLRHLEIRHKKIRARDFAFLRHLPRLKSLSLSCCDSVNGHVSQFLAHLKSLETLDLSYTACKNILFPPNLQVLTLVCCDNLRQSTLDRIADIKTLRGLTLCGHYKFRNLDVLRSLPRLEKLTLSGLGISQELETHLLQRHVECDFDACF